jgi:hypothetical protein
MLVEFDLVGTDYHKFEQAVDHQIVVVDTVVEQPLVVLVDTVAG